MMTGDRSPDPVFPDDERLFRRFHPSLLLKSGTIDKAAFEMPDMSVNREKHGGLPQFLLFGHCDWGVAAFAVGRVPKETFVVGVHYHFLPEHRRLRQNYHHAQLLCYDPAGLHLDCKTQFPEEVQLRWCRRLAFVARVVIRPQTFASDVEVSRSVT